MATKQKQTPKQNEQGSKPAAKSTSNAAFETRELRSALQKFHRSKPIPGYDGTIGGVKFGVYSFFDYDDEPIYVGQTRESLGSRISRHLTNQRSDAVAMNVLDPFEVRRIEVYPLPQYQEVKRGHPQLKQAQDELNALEYTVYKRAIENSKFKAILNEKQPGETQLVNPLPPSYSETIVSDDVMDLRGHPDTRIARRASTIARLAQVIEEREVQGGLRRSLVTQATRLLSLASERADALGAQPEVGESDKDSTDEE
ncbi:GIY-YIG nuclease family protein [Paraburkholderia tropica]|uniref:GIY-YIG catalytic domain-containing protein n=1 Tax=Paraburkholderia tropica TaxID=92647 RepID=A0AAQ1GN69_9BURK|nr:GIY-YIG nuclease family protein [Paraburkholderia tropica]RQN35687.1 GIY-YIG nuclease family protein [Paraburkholderia tropica]SEK13478.1 GIY-YIG catalytic domain-containing protein [Paraburkholderia tropica]